MRRPSPYRSIQTTIALASAGLVLTATIIIAVLSYTFTREAVTQTSRDYTGQLIAQVQTNIESYLTHMKNIAEVVSANADVERYFRGADELSAAERADYRESITTFLDSISRTRRDISLILIAGFDGQVLKHDPEMELNPSVTISEQPWFQRARDMHGQAYVSSSHVQNVVDGEYRWVITLSRTIHDRRSGEPYAVLLVDLNFSLIQNLVHRISLGDRGYFFIVDDEGGIVYHPRQELIYSDLEKEYIDRALEVREGSFTVQDEKGARLYTVRSMFQTGWHIVGVNYVSELVQNRATLQRYYIYWGLLWLLVALVVSVLVSLRISRPIMRLRESMKAVEQGNFDISVPVESRNEVGELAKDFNIMVAHIKDLMQRNAREQELKRKNELMALQNQITPHFLYNTLDSVIWMAEGKQYDNVIQTVAALARLLRLSISRGEELISVQDEIEHVRSYLTIQKLRYRDKLDFDIELDERVRNYPIPKVILQPLVENAVYHGIKNKEEPGRVTVSGALHDGSIVLAVEDDGVGMSAEQRASILEAPADSGDTEDGVPTEGGGAWQAEQRSADAGRGGSRGRGEAGAGTRVFGRLSTRRPRVGVRNVHERIQLYFGRDYGLSFHAREAGGTLVRVTLPLLERESNGGGA